MRLRFLIIDISDLKSVSKRLCELLKSGRTHVFLRLTEILKHLQNFVLIK